MSTRRLERMQISSSAGILKEDFYLLTRLLGKWLLLKKYEFFSSIFEFYGLNFDLYGR